MPSSNNGRDDTKQLQELANHIAYLRQHDRKQYDDILREVYRLLSKLNGHLEAVRDLLKLAASEQIGSCDI